MAKKIIVAKRINKLAADMTPEEMASNLEYQHLWRDAHPGYRTMKARLWRAAHPGYNAMKMREWRATNPDRNAATLTKSRRKARVRKSRMEEVAALLQMESNLQCI